MEQIQYGTRVVEYFLERRDRATLEITVEPDGVARVVAPIDSPVEDIAVRVRKRARWILAQQATFAEFRPHTPPRTYVPGETHLYLGRQYRIRVVPTQPGEGASNVSSTPGVKMVRGFLEVRGVDFHDTAVIEKHVTEWYRRRAHVQLPKLLELNKQRFPDQNAVQPTSFRLQRMPTRWGSTSPAGSLTLNPDLIRAPMDCIDYVVTHELCHLLVPNHGRQFYELQSLVMPDWERRKQRLERIMA
ncbi:SprT family zinc-dependent metalloprotease [Pseudarthrobacter sp. AL07]|uniref:M48 family metallopeptidase n=1 Tax=unclassified Pseudarthrobacter TaxID=2647000 RepID=UPI00249B28FF|nr:MULTISPECIES: SprT family zinc-dependent metalloprotease [unclassified Pseudarthrobacter]MDI3193997.1 SprT family zinc-dependent metalloprotease [Pseudarthrobacter sp. AL20]MDI3208042.1 SprT family zinc-dependent metalloprotease [Pseudarthrobacter sp. AL07]